MKMMKILVCRVWTRRNIAAFVVKFPALCNKWSLTEENDEIILLFKSRVSKLVFNSMVSSLKAPFALFHERRCFILSPLVLIIYA